MNTEPKEKEYLQEDFFCRDEPQFIFGSAYDNEIFNYNNNLNYESRYILKDEGPIKKEEMQWKLEILPTVKITLDNIDKKEDEIDLNNNHIKEEKFNSKIKKQELEPQNKVEETLINDDKDYIKESENNNYIEENQFSSPIDTSLFEQINKNKNIIEGEDSFNSSCDTHLNNLKKSLNQCPLLNEKNFNQSFKDKKNKNNNLLSKKRSLPNKDSFNEQDKNNFNLFKENDLKKEKKIKIDCNSIITKKVIFKCLKSINNIINSFSKNEYKIQLYPINLEEIIPKNDDDYQNFLEQKVIVLYLGENHQESLINKIMVKENRNQDINYKSLITILSMKIKEVLLNYVDGKQFFPNYNYNFKEETFKTDKEYNNELKIKIREEIHKLCEKKFPIFSDDIFCKNKEEIQEENKIEKKEDKEKNGSKREQYIIRKFIKKGILRFEDYINKQFIKYGNNFKITEIAIKKNIKNVKEQQDFLNKEMILIYKICFPKNCKEENKYKNLNNIKDVLELENNDNSNK